MELGMIGLVPRLLRTGHHCIVYNVNPDTVEARVKEGAGAL